MKIKNADAVVKFLIDLSNKDAVKGVTELEKKSEALSKKFNSVGKAMTIGVTTPLLGIAAAGIKYNASLETYTANLTTLLNGNQKAASQLLSDLKSMANTTPFETTSLVKATQTMLGFGIKVQDSQKYLKQLGDISMGDATKLEGLTLAFSQVQSAGKLTGQDLLQMINQGFNPLNIISQHTGESIASLKDRMGEGALSADEIAQSLQWATEEGGLFYGAMDKASQTTEGKLSTLKDEFNSAVGELTTNLLPIFTKTVDKLTEMARWFGNLSPKQKEFIGQMIKIGIVMGPTLIVIGKMITMVTRLNTALGMLKGAKAMTDVVSGFTKLGGAYSGLAKIIALLSGPVGIIFAIGAIIGAVVLLYNKCEWFRDGVNSLVSNIVSVMQSIAQSVISIGMSIWNSLQPIFNFIKSAIILNIAIVSTVVQSIFSILITIGSWVYTNVLAPIIKFFSSAFSFIWGSIVSPLIEKIKFGFNFIVGFVKSVFSNIKSFLGNIFGSIVGIIKSPINGVISAINSVLKSMNKIKIPDWVPGLGGKHPSFGMIPKLRTGTNYVAGEGLAYLHEGEAVVPKKYNPAVGGYGNSAINYINIVADMDVNKFGKAFVKDIKISSGGAKNSYNYGGGK